MWVVSRRASLRAGGGDVRLLKLDTGVDSSTRPARRLGRAGKALKSSRRRAAAAAKRAAVRLESRAIVVTDAQTWACTWQFRQASRWTAAVKGDPLRAPPTLSRGVVGGGFLRAPQHFSCPTSPALGPADADADADTHTHTMARIQKKGTHSCRRSAPAR